MKHLIILFIITNILSAQSEAQSRKGMIELTLDGEIYQSASGTHSYQETESSRFSPRIGLSRFVTGNVSANLELMMINVQEEKDCGWYEPRKSDQSGLEARFGFRYHATWKQWWPFIGTRITLQSGGLFNRGSRSPAFIGLQAGVKYWPMETGGIYCAYGYDYEFMIASVRNESRIDLGLVIRLK